MSHKLWRHILPIVPNSSTPKAAKMKNKSRKSRPRLPTWGRAWATVSSSRRTPFAVFSSFNTRAIRRTLITRIIEIFIGIVTTPKNMTPVTSYKQIVASKLLQENCFKRLLQANRCKQIVARKLFQENCCKEIVASNCFKKIVASKLLQIPTYLVLSTFRDIQG